jgi:UDP-N-acetylmuramate-alanine ligase
MCRFPGQYMAQTRCRRHDGLTGHIHILGICGTFMGGIALLARGLGYRVTGSDANVYPPM